MDAVVLVGGFGTRLRPLTLHRPKQMLPVLDRPMIEHVVGQLSTQGVTRAVLSLGYRPDAFYEAYPQGRCGGIDVAYAVEPEPLDTAGAIAFAVREADVDATFVAVNGDVIHRFGVADLLALHHRRDAIATIGLAPVADPSRFGVVVCDQLGRVTDFVEKPAASKAPSNQISVGIYVLEPQALESVPVGGRASIEREVFPKLVEQGSMYGLARDDFWMDAGTPETYLDVQLALAGGEWVHPSADVSPGASIEGSIVMQYAKIAAGTRLVGAAVLPGAQVGPGAVLDRCIVGFGAKIGAEARLSALAVVGDAAVVPPKEVLVGQTWP
ncbi:MAG: NDP-sugar synthase [bacterium]|nr:NDP-sugar synthase [bacterium]